MLEPHLALFPFMHLLDGTDASFSSCYCSQIIHLLNSCCVQEEFGDQVVSEGLGYLLIMPSCDVESGSETPVSWTGKKVAVNPTMDTAIGLADIQVIATSGKCTVFMLILSE